MLGSDAAPKGSSAAATCALCGKPNGCAMAEGASSAAGCWCMDEAMPGALSEQLKDDGVEWCICQACMRRAQQARGAAS